MMERRQLWIVTIVAFILVGISVYLHGRPTERAVETVAVRVEGAVRQPGNIVLANGMRVIDAIEACGGILPDAKTDGMDLSCELTEGQVIRIASAHMVDDAAKEKQSEEDNGIININTAGISELDRLPGIGPALAKAIIEYRDTNGRFQSVADIQRVKGIGKKKYAKIKDLIRTE